MVLVQKWLFFQVYFFSNLGYKNVFYVILEQKKTPFLTIKTRNSKSRKIDIFPKGLTDGFGLKMAIFATLIFSEIQAKKMSFTII